MFITTQHIILSLSIAVFAVVASQILITKENILEFYGDFLNKLDDKGYYWIAKPLGMCAKCFGGQIALWMFLFVDEYTILLHLFFIAWTIFFAELLTGIYGKIFM